MPLTRLSLFLTVVPFRLSNHIFYLSPVYRVHLSSFRNRRSVVLYCRTPSILLPHFCEVLFYTLKGRRHVYVVETVYIIRSQPHLRRHYEQIMQIFHPRHPVLMYLSSPRQVYSTEKLRSRNRHFSHSAHTLTLVISTCSKESARSLISSSWKSCEQTSIFSNFSLSKYLRNIRI